jgi:NitT/TauT family transport system ATP-binding protein
LKPLAPPAPAPAPVVSVDGVDKTWANGTTALARVSLAIQPGEFVSLLGPSGCGKTTLLSLIAGLDTPTHGAVRWWGTGQLPSARRIGYVFQSPTLMPWARVAANVRLPLDLAGHPDGLAQSDAAVARALDQVGLASFADAFPRQLSGGMRMRVSIARALVTTPQLLLMDEPFSALDEFARNRLDGELRDWWHAAGLTVAFVTHSIQEAVFLSTRVVVMAARPGRVIADIAIDEPHPRTAALRATAAFARHCADISQRVAEASAAPAPA